MKSEVKRLCAAVFVLIGVLIILYIASLNNYKTSGKQPDAVSDVKVQTNTTSLGDKIDGLLAEIIEKGPQLSSNSYDYIKDSKAYDELISLGYPAREYMLKEFAKSNSKGLRESIMAIACNKLSGKNENLTIDDGREWYYKYGAFDESKTFVEVDADYDLYEQKEPGSKEVILGNNVDKKNFDAVVDGYILAKNRKAYLGGEKLIEAHEIYRIDKGPEESWVYVSILYHAYEFRDDYFAVVSGGSNIVRMKVLKNLDGEYNVTEYKQAMDGGMYEESIREMFPKDIADKVMNRDKSEGEKLSKIIEDKAKAYVKSLGRDETKVGNRMERRVNTEAGLNGALYAVNLMRPDFPDWIGNREALIKLGGKAPGINTRCIYETKCEKIVDGEYIITLTKKWELKINGDEVISTWKYKVSDGKIELLEENDNDNKMRSIK